MVETATTKIEGPTTENQPHVAIKYISGVWKLEDRQWKVDTNIPKLGEGISLDIKKQSQLQTWWSNHCKFTKCGNQIHIWCMKTGW